MIRTVDQGLLDSSDVHRPGVDDHRLELVKPRVRPRHEGIGHPVDLTVRDLVRRRGKDCGQDLLSQAIVVERAPVWDPSARRGGTRSRIRVPYTHPSHRRLREQ